jgi:hypothetical protein
VYLTFLQAMSIANPADCEVRSVIRFLNAKNSSPAEIYRQIIEVYGEGVMNEGNVRKCSTRYSEPQARPAHQWSLSASRQRPATHCCKNGDAVGEIWLGSP